MNLDLRRIRSLIALAEHGGFRAAADSLGLSQPTLSAHIAQLETVLGAPLVSRTTRVVRLTTMGKRFLNRARRAVEEVELAVLELRDEAALKRGRVAVACTPTLAAHILPAAIRKFNESYAGISVQVIDDVAPAVERHVLEGAADIGFTAKPERTAALVYQRLAIDPFVAVLSLENPLAGAARLALRELAQEQMIALAPGTSIRRRIEYGFAEAGLRYEPRFEVRHHSTALGLAEAGLGVAILPRVALPQTRPRGLRVIVIDEPKLTRELGRIHRRGEALSPAALGFIRALHSDFLKTPP